MKVSARLKRETICIHDVLKLSRDCGQNFMLKDSPCLVLYTSKKGEVRAGFVRWMRTYILGSALGCDEGILQGSNVCYEWVLG
jgi:hypothetical protein